MAVSITSFEHVLELARRLPPAEQVRLRAVLAEAEAAARAEQIGRNQAALAMLDAWAEADDVDDGDEPWETMLQALDQHRESARPLYPHLGNVKTEPSS